MVMIPSIWLGTEESFYNYLYQVSMFSEKFSEPQLKGMMQLEDPVESIMDKHGDVGIVSIDGALVDSASFLDRLFGATAYSDVTEAINRHLEDKKVNNIVLSLSTPGGDASGIGEVSSFIKDAREIKPIASWTGKSALSAGYWIGASGSSFHASKMAETGSIGAIATVTSIARMLKEEGIDVHIERGGKFKAPIHPAEELSDEGKKTLKAKVGQLHDFFLEHVTSARPQLKLSEKSKWGEGQTFFTKEAIELGLVDGPPMSLGELVERLRTKKSGKSTASTSKSSYGVLAQSSKMCNTSTVATNEDSQMTKQVLLSEEAKAQAELGVPLDQIQMKAQTEAETVEATEKAEEVEKTEEVKTEADVVKTEMSESKNSVEAYLKEQLKELNSEVTSLKVEKSSLETQLSQLKDVESTLQPIAIEAINRLQIALGQSPSTLKGLPATALQEQYAALKDDFNKRFKAGQVSHGPVDESRQGRSLEELRLMSSVQTKK